MTCKDCVNFQKTDNVFTRKVGICNKTKNKDMDIVPCDCEVNYWCKNKFEPKKG